MKPFFLLLLFSFCISCSPKIIPVQNSYATLPITINSENNFDEVWDKLVDLFAQNGLSIKLIDRSSGLIVSDNSAITATWEDENGKLVHPKAYIVVPKYKNNNLQTFVPVVGLYMYKSLLKDPVLVRGEWNVRVKKGANGSIINVNLVNVTYSYMEQKVSLIKNLDEFKSTGNFERSITEIIK